MELTIIKKISFRKKELVVYSFGNGMNVQLCADTKDGECYADISTIIPTNLLLDSIWVKVGGLEEEIADKLGIEKTDIKTTSGYNTYVMYKLN